MKPPKIGYARYTLYDVNESGEITPREIDTKIITNSNDRNYTIKQQRERAIASYQAQSQKSYSDAILKSNQIKIQNLQNTYEQRLADVTSRENTFNTLADQIRGLTSGGGRFNQGAAFNSAMQNLNANRNYGSSDLATKLNFQVSDQQILDDLNTRKLQRLNDVVTNGNAQIAGITERLNTANTLLSSLPEGDPRRVSSDAYIKELQADLRSVQEAVASAQDQVTNY